MKERNIAVSIILTIITCGIYGLYWCAVINDELKENFIENNINFEVKEENDDLVYTVYGKAVARNKSCRRK